MQWLSFFVELVDLMPTDLPVSVNVHHIYKLPCQLFGSIARFTPALQDVLEEKDEFLLLQ